MILLLLLILILAELVRCMEFHRLFRLIEATLSKKPTKTPPKARTSFVVKRMEERLKEALYE